MGRVHVLLFATAPDGPAAVHRAYHTVSRRLAGTPGLLHNTLLEKADGSGGFVVVSVWEDLAAFRRWESGPEHRDRTAPLRPYHDPSMTVPFGVYQVAGEYPA